MLISGSWHLCDDGMVRPVLRAEILANDGTWFKARFLVDTGADRTVFNEDILSALQIPPIESNTKLSGVGGVAHTVILDTQIRMTTDQSTKASFQGQFAAFTDPEALDMCVFGRDILNLFAVLVDRQGDVVCLLGQNHTYSIGTR